MLFKKLFKCFCLLGLLTTSILIISNTKIQAASLFTVKKVNETSTLDGGISYIDEDISFSRYNKTGNFEGNFKALTMSGNNKQTHIVTWSATSAAKYATTNMTLDKIAADYEKNHPGWMVIAGVNSEGWWTEPAPYTEISNTYVQDYKQMRTSVSGESFKELIGFREDNTHFIKRVPTYSDKMQAWIYDNNGNTVSKLEISAVNRLPEGNEVTVIDLKNTKEYTNLEGYYVVKGTYDLYRPKTIDLAGAQALTDTADGIMIDGKLTDEVITSIKSLEYSFYYVTKDQSKYNEIKKGVSTLCQYEFLDEFKEAQSVTGYMFKIMENGHVMNADDYQDNSPYSDSFYYSQHAYVTGESKNRSCIGFKEDGSIILAISYNGSQGPSTYSLGNVLYDMGVRNAYQFDGGGSVTMIRRTNEGGFEFLNPGAYGSHTAVATGIFFVCPKDDIEVTTIEKQSVTFTNNNTSNTNVVVNLNGNKYPMVNNQVTINNLDPNTNYPYTISYDSVSYQDNKTTIKCTTATRNFTTKDFEAPWVALTFTEITKSTALVKINNADLKDIVLYVGKEVYELEDNTIEYKIDYLEPETEYKCYLKYTIIDPDTSKEYKLQTTEFDLKTTKYDTPTIKKFSFRKELNGEISFDYEIVDKDKRIKSITLVYDTCADTVEGLIGICKTSALDKTTDIYLEIEYLTDNDVPKTIKSDIYTQVIEVIDNPIKKGCNSSSVVIILSLIFSFNLIYLFKRLK